MWLFKAPGRVKRSFSKENFIAFSIRKLCEQQMENNSNTINYPVDLSTLLSPKEESAIQQHCKSYWKRLSRPEEIFAGKNWSLIK